MYSLCLDGSEETVWEPLWQIRTRLSPLEQVLLSTQPLRRLHHLAHSGSSSILAGYKQSRLQHTLGVFSLVAHFQPDNVPLRVAALLHDIGHYPFSHTLEQLPGVDHHLFTLKQLHKAPVAPLLQKYGVDIENVVQLIEGETPTILRNKEGVLHADHLDSWVRSGQARGQLGSGANLLEKLSLVGNYIETDISTADHLVELIVSEAHFHTSAANLGSSAVVSNLVSILLEKKVISFDTLAKLTDAELSFYLLNSPQTSAEARKLWFGPERLALSRNTSEQGILLKKDKLYLSLPQVAKKPADSPKIRRLLATAENLLGDYRVYWG